MSYNPWTLAEAQAIQTQLKTAYAALITGSEFSITMGGNTRRLKRQDMDQIRKEIDYFSSVIKQLENGTSGIPMKFGTSSS